MESARTRDRWAGTEAGRRYANARWSSAERRARDPRMVDALLTEHLAARGEHVLLDAPCGTGRLHATLARHGRYVGLDVAPVMLSEARNAPGRSSEGLDAQGVLLLGDVEALPFADGTFDAVVCCRLLHHLAGPEVLQRVVSELVRVSRALVIASFWDAAALPVWRRKLVPLGRAPRRFARSRAELAAAFARADAEVVGWKHSFRFVSRQAFVVARKHPAR